MDNGKDSGVAEPKRRILDLWAGWRMSIVNHDSISFRFLGILTVSMDVVNSSV